jgi:hypothetical protein
MGVNKVIEQKFFSGRIHERLMGQLLPLAENNRKHK